MLRFRFTIFCLWILFSLPLTLVAQAIHFEKGRWKDLVAKARMEKKLIFLDAYASWCGPCEWMEKSTFKDGELASYYNEHFINVKMNMEKGEGPVLAKRYKISAYPTLLYIDGQGQVVHRVVGALNAQRCMAEGLKALDPEQNLLAFQQKYKSGIREPAFLLAYLDKVIAAGYDGEEIVYTFLQMQPAAQLTSADNWNFIGKYINDALSPAFDYFFNYRQRFAAEYGSDAVHQKIEKVFYQNLLTYGLQGEQEKYTATKKKLSSCGFENSERLLLQTDIDLCKARGEWEEYARAVVTYHSRFISKDINELNGHAWSFYEHVEDRSMLLKAEEWIVRALKLQENYSVLDTYAALLFKLGKKEQAKVYAQKAIAKAKALGEDCQETERLLHKINQAE